MGEHNRDLTNLDLLGRGWENVYNLLNTFGKVYGIIEMGCGRRGERRGDRRKNKITKNNEANVEAVSLGLEFYSGKISLYIYL